MVNHIRTLLMNRSRDGASWAFPGEEFVVPNYRPRKLPLHLKLAHQTLFGNEPDRLYMNYRMREIMALLHATELEQYICVPDRRITYWPPTDERMFNQVFKSSAAPVGTHSEILYVFGTHECNEGAGQCQLRWRIDVLDETTVQVRRQTPPVKRTVYNYTLSSGLTELLPLEGSQLEFRFHVVPAGTAWIVESNARPQTDLGELMIMLEHSFGDEGIGKVFGPLPTGHMKVFKDVWDLHPLSGYRYAALLLAMARRIDELPQEGT